MPPNPETPTKRSNRGHPGPCFAASNGGEIDVRGDSDSCFNLTCHRHQTMRAVALVAALLCAVARSCAGLASSSLGTYLRFSPLIGGPRFLPAHVEVMLADESEGSLHRYDFVPANPTDPKTLATLLTLRSVPGVLRCRVVDSSSSTRRPVTDEDALSSPGELRTILAKTREGGGGGNIIRGKNGISFRLASVVSADSSGLISKADIFTQQYQRERGELNLLTNSCYVFAYDLLQFINKMR